MSPAPGVKLVLLHAGTNDGDCWQFMKLQGAHVHILPGHGNRPRKQMSLEEMADELVETVRGDLDLLGVALGGMVAQHALIRHPGRIRSAMLVCTSPSLAAIAEVCLERASTAEQLGTAGAVAGNLERWFTPQAIESGDRCVEYARRAMEAMDPLAYADMWRAMAEHDVVDRLSGIAQPVTLVAGLNDASLGSKGMELLNERLPNSRLEYLPGPHMLHLEQPAALRAALDRHLCWVEGSTSRASSMFLGG